MTRRPPRFPLFPSPTLFGSAWHRLRQRNEVSTRHSIRPPLRWAASIGSCGRLHRRLRAAVAAVRLTVPPPSRDRKSTRLNSSHLVISYAVFCLKKKNTNLYAAINSNDRENWTNFPHSALRQ